MRGWRRQLNRACGLIGERLERLLAKLLRLLLRSPELLKRLVGVVSPAPLVGITPTRESFLRRQRIRAFSFSFVGLVGWTRDLARRLA